MRNTFENEEQYEQFLIDAVLAKRNQFMKENTRHRPNVVIMNKKDSKIFKKAAKRLIGDQVKLSGNPKLFGMDLITVKKIKEGSILVGYLI